MFKGLKSRLEDEAKRLQNTVSQYGESLAQQVRATSSDMDDGVEKETKRVLSTRIKGNKALDSSEKINGGDLIDELHDHENSSALMQESFFSDESRQRRESGGSVESAEGSLFSSIPGFFSSGHRLETISSDVESESFACSSQISSVSKEQISTVLLKLQRRAANYKDKFRSLVNMYNEVVKENEKYQAVLASTQDKALDRINKLRSEKKEISEKLKEINGLYDKEIAEREIILQSKMTEEFEKVKTMENLLESYSKTIKEDKSKIRQLTEENETLNRNAENLVGEMGLSDLAVERMTAEWKGRMDSLESDWLKRLQDSHEEAALTIAKAKAEMHATLEEKEAEVQNLRAKCKGFELQDLDIQKRNNDLQSTIEALELEKADMVEKLSQAKIQGVKAVRDEEEKKRLDLIKDMQKKREEDKIQCEANFNEEVKKIEQNWLAKFREQEEQMQLAIEEREMQKVAAVMQHDRKNDDLGLLVEQLTAEKLQLITALDDLKRLHKIEIDEQMESVENILAKHKEEVAFMIKEHEEILRELQNDYKRACSESSAYKESLQKLEERYKVDVQNLERKAAEIAVDLGSELKAAKKTIKSQANENEDMKKELNELRTKNKKLDDSIKEKEVQLISWRREIDSDSDEIATLRQKLDTIEQAAENESEQYKREIDELRMILKEKAALLKNMEEERALLIADLASSQELSKVYEHLKDQLEIANRERMEAEHKYLKLMDQFEIADNHFMSGTVDEQIMHQDSSYSYSNEIAVKLDKISENETTEEEIAVQSENILLNMSNETSNGKVEKKHTVVKENEDLRLELMEAKRKATDEDLKECAEEVNSLSIKNAELKEEVDKKKMLIEELQRNMNESIQEYELLKRNDEVLTSKFSKMQEEYAEIRCDLERWLENLSYHMDAFESNVNKICDPIQNKIGFLQDSLLSVRSKLNAEVNSRSQMENENKFLIEKVEQLKAKGKENEKQHEQLENFVTQLQKEMLESNEIQNSQKEEIEALSKKLEEADKIARLADERANQKEEAEKRIKSEFDRSFDSTKRLNEEISELKNKLEQASKTDSIVRDQLLTIEKAEKERLKLNAEIDSLNKDKENLFLELENAKKDTKEIRENMEEIIADLKRKAEIKLTKIKQSCEAEMMSAKAELILQLDEVQTQLRHREEIIDELKLNIASLNQSLLDKEDLDQEINELRSSISTFSSERIVNTEEIKRLSVELNVFMSKNKDLQVEMENKNAELSKMSEERDEMQKKQNDLCENLTRLKDEKYRKDAKEKSLFEELATKDEQLVNFQKKCEEMEEANKKSTKAIAKADNDRSRLIRDLQKEIKQLYQDLNDRGRELAKAKNEIEELRLIDHTKMSGDGMQTNDEIHRLSNSDEMPHIDYEELQSLKEQVNKYQNEILELNAAHRNELKMVREEALLAARSEAVNNYNFKNVENSIDLMEKDSGDYNFGEPTEAEYLRNVLYRYMNERETLGKESVTLARVLATVAKFSDSQLNEVVMKEEQRNSNWYSASCRTFFEELKNSAMTKEY